MFIAAALLALILVFISIIMHDMKTADYFTPTYIPNVYINDLSLSGYTKDDGVAYVNSFEDEWRSESFTLTYLDYRWTFSRADMDADIAFDQPMELAWNLGHVGTLENRRSQIEAAEKNPVYLTADITYNESKADALIDEICSAIHMDAVDAVVVSDVNQPKVISESKTGLDVNRELLRSQLKSLIHGEESDTSIPVETVFPAVSADLTSFQKIAEFSTDVTFRNGKSRSNVRLALSAFNGLTVNPGETCSFNEIVGPRTAERGFQEATEYAGDLTTNGIGGGTCQASTTLYNALIMANMTVLERDNHGMTVSYVNPSLDAAVSYPDKDLIFRNDTEHPIYLYTSVDKERATVSIYGHKPDYFYRLESVIVKKNVPSTRNVTIEDTEGTHVYYIDDPPVLESSGKAGCVSQGWVVAYDWNTKEEVSRTQVSNDSYRPGASVYYVGVHPRISELIPALSVTTEGTIAP